MISVIVPVYRVEAYLDRCIESIRSQTDTDLEIILVDDGSPDRCGQICDRYASIDDRITAGCPARETQGWKPRAANTFALSTGTMRSTPGC